MEQSLFYSPLKDKPISRGRGKRRNVELVEKTIIGHSDDRPEIEPVKGQFDDVEHPDNPTDESQSTEIQSANSQECSKTC